MFTPADFELYGERFQADQQWNGRRLDVRHRLQAFGERVKEAYARLGVGLDRRESLHHPHHTNQNRVQRQRTTLFRDKKARRALQQFLGRDLGKDLDSALNNLHLQFGLNERQVYWGLRIDKGAWYDLNVLLKRAEEQGGREEILQACAAAPGFLLEVDGRGPRPLSAMDSRDWRDLAGLLKPGVNGLEIVQRLAAPAAAAAGEDLEPGVLADLERLAPLYRLACWSLDGSSPFGASL